MHRSPCTVLLVFLTIMGCRGGVSAPPAPPFFDVHAVAEHAHEHPVFSSPARDLAHAPVRLWDDGKVVFLDGSNLLWLALATVYGFATENYFEEREAVFFKNHTLYGRNISDGLAVLGNGLTLYTGVLTWYFVAHHGEHLRSYEGSKTVLSAMTITSATTLLLKGMVTDGRPNGGSHDFPSGHASLSMSVAASLDELYGHTVGYIGYGLTTLVSLQRLDTGKHDTGSVVFGLVLGYVTGKSVARHHAPRIFGMDVGFVQDPDSGAPGISLSRSF